MHADVDSNLDVSRSNYQNVLGEMKVEISRAELYHQHLWPASPHLSSLRLGGKSCSLGIFHSQPAESVLELRETRAFILVGLRGRDFTKIVLF